MGKDVFVGRILQKHLIGDSISKLLDDTKDNRSFLSFKNRQKESAETVYPRIFLLDGINGSGKSALLSQCTEQIQGLSIETKKPIKIINIDFEDIFNKKGTRPSTPRQMLELLYDAVKEQAQEIAILLDKYIDQNKKIQLVTKHIDELRREVWPRVLEQILTTDQDDDFTIPEKDRREQQFLNWIKEQNRIPKSELDLFERADDVLTDTFTSSIAAASEHAPIILILDACEISSTNMIDEWFRAVFTTRLYDSRNRIAMFISSEMNIVRAFRNDLPDDLVLPVHLTDHFLTKNNIAYLASKLRLKLDDNESKWIEEVSTGIPLVVMDIFDYVKQSIPLEEILQVHKQSESIESLVNDCVIRFLSSKDELVIWRVCHYAMSQQFNPKLFAALWNISFADVTTLINEHSTKYSFIDQKRLHPSFRKYLRQFLISEVSKGEESGFHGFFKEFCTISSGIYCDQISQLETTITSADKRIADERYQSAVIGHISCLLWHSREEALNLASGYMLESIEFSPQLIPQIIGTLNEFNTTFTEEQLEDIRVLSNCTAYVNKDAFWHRCTPSKEEKAVLGMFEKRAESFSRIQKALLAMLKGELSYLEKDYKTTKAAFDTAAEFIGHDGSRLVLFDHYTLLAEKLLDNKKYLEASFALTEAASLNPENYNVWFNLGTAYIALDKHNDSIVALSEAIRISGDKPDSWALVAHEYLITNQFESAMQAFANAIEKGIDSEEIWFGMSKALIALTRHPEAIKALQKVVNLNKENAEAWFMIGKSSSAQALSDEAIDAFHKACEVKPDYTESWTSMGMELYNRGFFEDSASAYDKAASLDTSNYELWYFKGLSLYVLGKNDEAIEAFRKVIDINSGFALAWKGIGHAFVHKNEADKALEAYLSATAIEQNDIELWSSIGNCYFTITKYHEAIESYRKALEINSQDDMAWYNIGLAYHIQNKFKEAVDAYEKAELIAPQNAETWFNKGRAHTELNEHELAAQCYGKTAELTPNNYEPWFRKAQAQAAFGNHADAISSYEKAFEVWPSDPEIWHQAGLSYKALSKNDLAIKAFNEAVELTNDRLDSWLEMGIAQQKLNLYKEAVESFKKVVSLDEENKQAWSGIGICQYNLGLYNEALDSLDSVLTIDPKDQDALYHAALVCHALCKFDDAVKLYCSVLEVKPDMLEALYNMGLAYHALNRFENAIEVYKKVILIAPKNSGAWYHMGLSYHAENRYPDAIKAYREAAKLTPNATDIWYNIGIAFHAQEHFGEAIQAYRKVVQLAPDRFDALFNLGLAYHAWENFHDAMEAYQKAVTIKPDYIEAWGNYSLSSYAAGDFAKAIETSRGALKLTPGENWIRNILALSLFSIGNAQESFAEYEKIIVNETTTTEEIQHYQAQFLLIVEKEPSLGGAQEINNLFEKAISMGSVQEPESAMS